MERRQHPRYACFEEVNVIIKDMTHSGVMLNRSEGGFFIMTSLDVMPGQFVGLNYFSRVTQKTLHFDCRIVRREETGIGLMIALSLN